ncbi:SMI1/KNR4 family protein [Archangium violaceum]|uniref:SMI1/KNR4 family protein n=1 Tax=Archangium violaceum TaxID=83451 RepID=UPI002B2B61F5|nr:SMI1/KNR4 family protein [Archangium violaceum]
MTMTIRWLNYLWQEPHPATLDEIELLERQWDVQFPEEYKKVVSLHQGMTPEPCVFDVGRGTDVFNTLLTLCEDERWRVYSVRGTYQALKPHVPPGIYPFGDTPGGQYVCFDYRTTPKQPKIVLVTVETDIHPIADSFSDFLAMLHD